MSNREYSNFYFDLDIDKSFNVIQNKEWAKHEEFVETIEIAGNISIIGGGSVLLGRFKDGDYFYNFNSVSNELERDNVYRKYYVKYKVFKNALTCLEWLINTEFQGHHIKVSSLDKAAKEVLAEEDLVAYHLTRSVFYVSNA